MPAPIASPTNIVKFHAERNLRFICCSKKRPHTAQSQAARYHSRTTRTTYKRTRCWSLPSPLPIRLVELNLIYSMQSFCMTRLAFRAFQSQSIRPNVPALRNDVFAVKCMQQAISSPSAIGVASKLLLKVGDTSIAGESQIHLQVRSQFMRAASLS